MFMNFKTNFFVNFRRKKIHFMEILSTQMHYNFHLKKSGLFSLQRALAKCECNMSKVCSKNFRMVTN